ncbi:eIF2A-related protein [Streptomyces sp. OE57]|uniref:nSTAND1 domain-containing NTPase n=1 Tax=Streptomyces lacaronensis TaxID=3379885 RepID=UPI0039B73308
MDPAAGPVQRFAYELRKLRQETGGLTYRVMAQRTEYSVATLSRAAAGEQLPSLAAVLAYARACGADPQEWERRWRAAAHEVVAEPGADDVAHAPYRGLARFEPDDREVFFGREDLVAQLADRVDTHRLVALVGASGSGKSSLLRAGLIPRLRAPSEHGPQPVAIRVITPGEYPLRTHALRLAPAEEDGDTVLIVDQFEELYTLGTPPHERNQFIDQLLAATDPASRLRVVIAVRADFLSRCAEHHLLAAALREATLLVGPMSPAELRQAIVKPAAAAGLIVERALTAKIIEEVTDKPGGLPLMSHALLETWRRRTGRTLTLTAYNAADGVAGAIARTAEDFYARLSPHQAGTAQEILLRLINPGEGTQDTSRPAPREELAPQSSPATAEVLEGLATARLVTLDGLSVALVHEALITAWPRLRQWIDQARERLRVHRQLTEAVHIWEHLDRDPGALYRGARLELAAALPGSTLSASEREFLDASLAAQAAEAAAVRRRNRWRQQAMVLLSILFLVATATATYAVHAQRAANRQRDVARSRELAARSDATLSQQPETAMMLALKGFRLAPTVEARSSLLSSYAKYTANQMVGHTDAVNAVAFAPDGRTLATGSADHTVKLWNTTTHREIATLTGHANIVNAVVFSPDGRMLATGSSDGKVKLWDTTTRKITSTIDQSAGTVLAVAFSPDSRSLAAAGSDRRVRVWSTASRRLTGVLTGPLDAIRALAFSPNGRAVVAASDDGTARLWNVSTRRVLATLKSGADSLTAAAFSRDGRTVVTAGPDSIKFWDSRTYRKIGRLTGDANGVAFSPDGRTLATADRHARVTLWSVASRRATAELGDTATAERTAFSPDGATVATTFADGTVQLWDVSQNKEAAAWKAGDNAVWGVAFSPEGRTLATGSYDHTVRLWNTATHQQTAILRGHRTTVLAVAFSPDGRTLATGAYDGTVRLWNVAERRSIAILRGHKEAVNALAFSPDGQTLASASNDRTARLWNIASRRSSAVLEGHTDAVTALAFSRDGHTLATASGDRTARLWSITRPRGIAVLHGHTDVVTAVAFTASGRTLITGSHDRTVRLWEVDTGQTTAVLDGDNATIKAIALNPQGRTLATLGGDTNDRRLWNLDTEQTAERICQASRVHHWAKTLTDSPSPGIPSNCL